MTARRLAKGLARGLAGRLTLVTEYIEPAFVNDVAPVVSGTAAVGSVLSVTDGTWTPTPAGYSYQWRRGGDNIGSATADSYTLVEADLGELIDCVVTADDGAGGFTSAVSNSVGPVAEAPDVDPDDLELYAGGNLELYGGGNLELYASAYLALYAGGYLDLYSGGKLHLYMFGIPENALLDSNGEPILDTDGQYILGV